MNVAIVLAAGEGRRMRQSFPGKEEEPKQFLSLQGKPVVVYALQVFEECVSVDKTILVTNSQKISFCKNLASRYGLSKVAKIVEGGERRQDSVFRGLKALPSETEVVVVHDGVRPFITPEMVERVFLSLGEFQGVVVGVSVTDTLKTVTENEVTSTLKRNDIWLAQTPQLFPHSVFLKAHFKAQEDNFYGTDDACLVERMGGKIRMVEGSYENLKLTTPTDLLAAEAILKNRSRVRGQGSRKN